uniref:Uncharacterized protein n=2 Tax=Timema TaxID=61471 RepID=A0A7R9D8W6_TIMPO|nr:unnamed protein product [Timema douglasi]CAD7409374.1 unnamed protein product [Timema poppensis]
MVQSVGGIKNVEFTSGMLHAARRASSKRREAIEEMKKKESEEANRSKTTSKTVNKLESKKRKLLQQAEEEASALQTEIDLEKKQLRQIKRLRSLNREEDCCNFMPISKRNNLHSNNSSLYIGFPHLHTEHALVKQAVDYTENLGESGGGPAMGHTHPQLEKPGLSPYNPNMSPQQNPYYYENNKLLYNLYMERMRRGSQGQY